APWPVIALVGYTNAGKSTLFNRLTGADVMAENLLFATLDPTLRQIQLPGIDKAILSDTVGFVSELPTQLVAAFKATLEEVVSADLLIHVRDIAHPDTEAQRADVEEVLREIGVADTTPRFEAWNKIDLLDGDEREDALAEAARRDDVVAISAMSGEGVEELKREVAAMLTAGHRRYSITLDAADGAGAAWLHQHGEVLGQAVEGDRATYDVRMAPRDYERFETRR
ncbi:MAG TPA: GTPase, partial [Sphingomonas sp.]|nr:GTPase [Sphingomonas sp.]